MTVSFTIVLNKTIHTTNPSVGTLARIESYYKQKADVFKVFYD